MEEKNPKGILPNAIEDRQKERYFATVFLPFLIFSENKLINDISVNNIKVNQALMVNFERVHAELTDAQIDEIITFAKQNLSLLPSS